MKELRAERLFVKEQYGMNNLILHNVSNHRGTPHNCDLQNFY